MPQFVSVQLRKKYNSRRKLRKESGEKLLFIPTGQHGKEKMGPPGPPGKPGSKGKQRKSLTHPLSVVESDKRKLKHTNDEFVIPKPLNALNWGLDDPKTLRK